MEDNLKFIPVDLDNQEQFEQIVKIYLDSKVQEMSGDRLTELTVKLGLNPSETNRYLCVYIEDKIIACTQILLINPNVKHHYLTRHDRQKEDIINYLQKHNIQNDDILYKITFHIHSDYWDKGYGTKIVNFLINYVKNLGAKGVCAEVRIENQKCSHILEKCDMEKIFTGIVSAGFFSFAKINAHVKIF